MEGKDIRVSKLLHTTIIHSLLDVTVHLVLQCYKIQYSFIQRKSILLLCVCVCACAPFLPQVMFQSPEVRLLGSAPSAASDVYR